MSKITGYVVYPSCSGYSSLALARRAAEVESDAEEEGQSRIERCSGGTVACYRHGHIDEEETKMQKAREA